MHKKDNRTDSAYSGQQITENIVLDHSETSDGNKKEYNSESIAPQQLLSECENVSCEEALSSGNTSINSDNRTDTIRSEKQISENIGESSDSHKKDNDSKSKVPEISKQLLSECHNVSNEKPFSSRTASIKNHNNKQLQGNSDTSDDDAVKFDGIECSKSYREKTSVIQPQQSLADIISSYKKQKKK